MGIEFSIRVPVMMPMVRRPPERTPLDSGRSEDRHHELKGSAGAERPMREVTVVEAGYGEHPYSVRGQSDED